MAFPLSSVFEGLKGLVHITVTADANGDPELVHLVDEAGQACAHFAIHEWDSIGEHIANLIHKELGGQMSPAVPAPAAPADSGVTTPTLFLSPHDATAAGTEPGAGDPAAEETAPAAEDQHA